MDYLQILNPKLDNLRCAKRFLSYGGPKAVSRGAERLAISIDGGYRRRQACHCSYNIVYNQ